MLTHNTTGAAPRHRCINRSLLALATLAAFSLIAPTAQAAVAQFAIDPVASSLTFKSELDLSKSPTAPQILYSKAQVGSSTSIGGATNGDTSHFGGTINADLNPGTIELLSSSSIVANSFGTYSPFDTNPADPPAPPPTTFQPNANFGIRLLALINLVAEQHDVAMTFGAPAFSIPTVPAPLVAGSFNLTGQAMSMTGGRQAYTSSLGTSTDDITGFPTVFSTFTNVAQGGQAGPDIGTFDGFTLTIPVHSKVITTSFNDLGFPATVSTIYTGVIVAHLVPEPSSIVMLGFGVVGMLAYGLRARNHSKKNA